jgi:hypothetical protein
MQQEIQGHHDEWGVAHERLSGRGMNTDAERQDMHM